LIRACYLHYESDPELHNLKYQYLLGKDLMVAPVYKPYIKKWKVYLLEDDWIHVWSNKTYSKGWHEIDTPIGKPAIIYLKNSKFSDLFKKIRNL